MDYINVIAKFFYRECIIGEDILAETIGEKKESSEEITRMISSLLRLKKFFKEKGGEEV